MTSEFILNPFTGNLDAIDVSTNSSTPSMLVFETNCSETEKVGDAVYVYNNGQVRQANASTITTAKVVGFIIEKPTDTTCKVLLAGVLEGKTGLNVNKQYFLSETPGQITTTAPTTPGSVVTHVGIPFTTTKLIVGLSKVYTIRS